ncbi:MAG: phosphatase [Clostridiales bacterium 38-18]|nr:MAG: phosphatase [Clostridiales bacterium 38-18]
MQNTMDLHTHTIASGHAYSTLTENLNAAREKGLRIIGISDHAPAMPGSTHEYYFSNLRVIPEYIDGIRVLKGVELNILDGEGRIDLDERTLSFLDYAIVSLHPPCFDGGNAEFNTDAILKACEHPLVKIIGHPDDSRYPLNYERLVVGAKERGVLLEVNNSSLSPNAFRENARENYLELLKFCKLHEVMVIINSDSHYHQYIGEDGFAKALLSETEFPEHLIANYTLAEEVANWLSTFEKNRR